MAKTTENLADLLSMIADSDLPATRRRDISSAIRSAAKALRSTPAEVALDVGLLRRRLEEVDPESLGLTRLRWNNIRSLLSYAVGQVRPMMPSVQRTQLSAAWQAKSAPLKTAEKYRLSPLLRFLSSRGVEPSNISLADIDAFRSAILEGRMRANPERTWYLVSWNWNKLVEQSSDWPQVRIPECQKKTVYIGSWTDFPPSLKNDVDAYLKVLRGDVISEDGPQRALRPATLQDREYQLRGAACALAACGVPAEKITAVGDIARLEPMKLILAHFFNRGGGNNRYGTFGMAQTLKAAAKHWVKVDDEELTKIKKIVRQLSPKKTGLTHKNRERLLPFNDFDVVQRFLALPQRIVDDLKKKERKSKVDAVSAQIAVAIAILQTVPIRLYNLVSLDLHRHLIERGGRVYVLIPGEEVKNSRPYELELPRDVVDLISWYCLNHRSRLIKTPTSALFPSARGEPKNRKHFGLQISRKIRKYLGLSVNPHLFRHVAAKLYLDRHPGQYAVVSRLLNHGSVATTMAAYTGAESVSAARHYQELVHDIRSKAHNSCGRRVKS